MVLLDDVSVCVRFLAGLLFCVWTARADTVDIPDETEVVEGTHVGDIRGYFKREHSLTKPYQGKNRMQFYFVNNAQLCLFTFPKRSTKLKDRAAVRFFEIAR